jgi:hypothetical protein
MTPINLGNLPLNLPAPLGQGQVKPGVTDGATNFTNAVAAVSIKDSTGGAGNPIAISVTPRYDCYWRVTANNIWYSPDAVWTRADWGIDLSPADMDGYIRCYGMMCLAGASTQWNHGHLTAIYHLRGGTLYTATMMWIASPSGYNQQIWNGGGYTSMSGHTLAEGRV